MMCIVSSPKMIKTNQNVVTKVDIKSDRSSPQMKLDFCKRFSHQYSLILYIIFRRTYHISFFYMLKHFPHNYNILQDRMCFITYETIL